jgi:hypothetical protein
VLVVVNFERDIPNLQCEKAKIELRKCSYQWGWPHPERLISGKYVRRGKTIPTIELHFPERIALGRKKDSRLTRSLFFRPRDELGLHPGNQKVRILGLSDYPKLVPFTLKIQGCGTVTNHELVQPHKVNFYGIREAVLLRFKLRPWLRASNSKKTANSVRIRFGHTAEAVQAQFTARAEAI